jgi:hypothetical protein
MDDTDRLIVQQKLQQIRDDQEFAVEGSAIGEEGWVPCVVSEESTGKCLITISDGHRTGESVSVDSSHVVSFGTEFVKDATGRLFR